MKILYIRVTRMFVGVNFILYNLKNFIYVDILLHNSVSAFLFRLHTLFFNFSYTDCFLFNNFRECIQQKYQVIAG